MGGVAARSDGVPPPSRIFCPRWLSWWGCRCLQPLLGFPWMESPLPPGFWGMRGPNHHRVPSWPAPLPAAGAARRSLLKSSITPCFRGDGRFSVEKSREPLEIVGFSTWFKIRENCTMHRPKILNGPRPCGSPWSESLLMGAKKEPGWGHPCLPPERRSRNRKGFVHRYKVNTVGNKAPWTRGDRCPIKVRSCPATNWLFPFPKQQGLLQPRQNSVGEILPPPRCPLPREGLLPLQGSHHHLLWGMARSPSTKQPASVTSTMPCR